MNAKDKQSECDRICGPYFSEESRKNGLHETNSLDLDSPNVCPIQRDLWRKPKRKNEYVGL